MTLRIWPSRQDAKWLDAPTVREDPGTSSLESPPVLDGDCTLAEQAVALAAAHGLAEPPPLADFVVDLLDAEDLLHKRTWHFSRGELQIAGLVLLFSRPFSRLILIEPTAGLDPRRVRLVTDFLADLAEEFDVDVISASEAFRPFR